MNSTSRKTAKGSNLAKKIAQGVVAIAATALMHAPGALAQPTIGVNALGTGPGGGYAPTDLWTNVTDSALAVGFDPTVLIPPGAEYDIRLISQARVSAFNLGPDVVFPQSLTPNNQFEVTKVLDINERVLFNDGNNANFGLTAQTADVDPVTPGLQQLAIYFDNPIGDGTQAVPGDGAGTVRCYGTGTPTGCGATDGVLALSARLVFNVSSFAVDPLGTGTGTGSFDLRFIIDFVNPAFLDAATGNIIGDKITGTTNVPTQFSPAVMWNGVPTNTGLLLKVDSSETFLAVPEPDLLALLGLSLAALGFSVFRKRTL